MASGITWVYSDKGGYFPCSSSQELTEFKKVGFVECGKPSKHKAIPEVANLKVAEVSAPIFSPKPVEESKELSRDELIALAEEGGIFIDKRWSAQRIKEAIES